MDIALIQNITTIAFLVVIGFMGIVSILAAYIFIRYGRTKKITLAMSIVFGVLFFLGAVSAFATLQNIF